MWGKLRLVLALLEPSVVVMLPVAVGFALRLRLDYALQDAARGVIDDDDPAPENRA